ncbi:phage tail protein [Sphingobium sp. AN558]|uniref:phage tail protein n=1 Tax=Sphingobium sp. AN558 TaxID=3133442 RepID=UPI0030C4806F
MRKADSIRRWLAAYIPELKDHPDRLQIYVEGGHVGARKSRTLSFAYRYTLKVGIWEFAGDADRVMVPILAWLEKEQPQLLRRDDGEPFSFEAELLDGDVSDIMISIDLTETVLVLPRGDGSGYDVQHPNEPDFGDAFAGVSASFTDAFGNDEPLSQS